MERTLDCHSSWCTSHCPGQPTCFHIGIGWDIPFLDVWTPEIACVSSRDNDLLPGAVACNADVTVEEKFEDIGHLRTDKKECGVCIDR
jgi:hypothetical protein